MSCLKAMLLFGIVLFAVKFAGAISSFLLSQESGKSPCAGEDFHCAAGGRQECIPMLWLCDDHKDCNDGADELDESCPDHANIECMADQIECPSNHKCIPDNFKCDGTEDCPTGFDEKNCRPNTCADSEFECHSRDKCVPHGFTCDDVNDCEDGSDELHCECSARHVFHCADGKRCPPITDLCNGKRDCEDGSDEGGSCSEDCTLPCKNGKCFQSPKGSQCDCNDGYVTSGKQCLDVDECMEGSPCDHFCRNSDGNYTCTCAKDYKPSPGGLCKADGNSPAILFYTYNNEIRALDVTNKRAYEIYAGPKPAIAVAYDPISRRVYWSDRSPAVYRKYFKGDDAGAVILHKDLGDVTSIAIDWVGRNMYLAATGRKSIVVCNLNKMACKDLLTKPANPISIQLDIAHRSIYWTEDNAIMKARMDGGNQEVLVSQNVSWPNALAVDVPARTLYWLDAKHKTLETFALDRQERKEIVDVTVHHPYSMAVWEDKLYWIDWEARALFSAHKKDGKNQSTIFSDFDGNALTIYHKQMLSDSLPDNNPCELSGCSHICLLAGSASATCGCPPELKLSSDGENCRDLNKDSSLVVGFKTDLYKVKPREFIKPLLQRLTLTPSAFKRISDIDYNPLTGEVFICDQGAGTIYKLNVARRSLTTVVTNLTKPTGIAADWARGHLYWVDYIRGTLEVSTMDGQYRSKLNIERSCKALDVAVSPTRGLVLIACDSPGARILSCTRKGAPCEVIASFKVSVPLGLTIDQRSKADQVYWTDSRERHVVRTFLDGKVREPIELNDRKVPGGIHVSAGKLYVSVVGDAENLQVIRDVAENFKGFNNLLVDAEDISNGIDSGGHIALTEIDWDVDEDQINDVGVCDNRDLKCHQLCLEDESSNMVCACGVGEMLAPDNFSCLKFDCGDEKYTCVTDEKCLPLSWRCNGHRDCSDGSDENLSQCKCDETQFTCMSSYKKCIEAEKRCDGRNDCWDNSDEKDCTDVKCLPGFAKCSNGSCYLKAFRCDGRRDCGEFDDTDERDCQCATGELTCANGQSCYQEGWKCDGFPDCTDNSDEENCSMNCTSAEFMCRDNGQCLELSKRCNSERDCDDGEDEDVELCYKSSTVCATGDPNCRKSCRPGEFVCISDHHCVMHRQQCDGVSDCEDASDEKYCSIVTNSSVVTLKECEAGMFNCGLGECVPTSFVCNGKIDCVNAADEGPKCDGMCTSGGGCDHYCREEPQGRKCYCRKGYKLQDDGQTCLDYDECEFNRPCEQYCTNVEGGFLCTCDPGYTLSSNFVSCKPTSGRQSSLVVLSGGSLRWTGAPSKGISTLQITLSANISQMVYDDLRDNLLTLDYGGVVGIITTHDSSFSPVIVGLEKPTALAMDTPGRNFYIAQSLANGATRDANLMVCSIRTMVCWTVYQETGVVISSVTVAKKDRKLYICLNGPSGSSVAKIVKMQLDGMQKITILDKGMNRCSHMALDETKETIYWVDPLRKTVNSALWSGHRATIFKQLQSEPVNLEFSGSYVTWILESGIQQRCHRRGNWCSDVHLGAPALAVTIPAVRDTESSVCTADSCINLCLTVSGSPVCRCDDPSSDLCTVQTAVRSISSCEPNPCPPGEVCLLKRGSGFKCRCDQGTPCYISKTKLDDGGGDYVTPLVIVLVLVILVALGGCLYYYYKRPLILLRRKSSKSQVRFSNPAFGAPEEEICETLRSSGQVAHKDSPLQMSHESGAPLQSVHIDTDVNLTDGGQDSGSEYSASRHSQGRYPLM